MSTDGERSPSPGLTCGGCVVGVGYVQIDPEKTRELATVLAQQSLAADASASRINAALTLSGLVSTVPARLAGRSDDWLLMASVLQQRATEAESFLIDLPSSFTAPATSVELSERFDGVLVAAYERPPTPVEAYEADVARFDDLVDAIESWPGTDNDPLFDAMVNDRDELFAYLTAGLDLDLIAAIWAQTNEGVEFIDAARQAMADREARVASASETIGALLHVDDQSGLSPWADGDAEVTVEEVEAVFAALGGLNDAEAALVWQTIDPEALERLLHVMETGHEAGADNPWGHTAWAAPRWIGRFGEAAVVETWNATVTVGEAFAAATLAYAHDNERPLVGGQALPDEVWRVSGATAAGAEVIAAGNVPFATNYVRCTTGDGRACVMLGVEITLEVVGGFVVGRVASVIGRAGGRLLVRFVTRNGDEQIVAIPAEILERELVDTFGGPVEFDDAGRVVTDLVDDHGLPGDLDGPEHLIEFADTGQVIPTQVGRVPVADLDKSTVLSEVLNQRLVPTPMADALLVGARQVSGDFPRLAGPSEVLLRRGPDGSITYYQVYDELGRPVMRVDLVGRPHAGIPTPHVQLFEVNTNPVTGQSFVSKGEVRAALPEEIPS